MIKNIRLIISTIMPLAIFLLIALFLAVGLRRDPHHLPSTFIGKPVPLFQAPDLDHPQQMITNLDFKGQITLLNVFATWCLPCQYENPTLLAIKNSMNLNVVGLNYKDDVDVAIKWLRQYGNPYHQVIEDPTGQIGINFGVYGTPETFVIDAQGIIRYKFVGAMGLDDWEHTILPMVRKLQQETFR